jgi:signal transduction histidine kinase
VQLQQVVVNLVLNATQAMQDVAAGDRAITVSTWGRGDRANVRIDDTGHGLPPEKLETVFDSFYTTKEGGMGIGLAVCRSIVEQHGGAIAAIALPLGARFEFSLPTLDPGDGR